MTRLLALLPLAACVADPTKSDPTPAASDSSTPEEPDETDGCRGCGSTSSTWTTYTATPPTDDVDYEVSLAFQLVPTDGSDPGAVAADFVGGLFAVDDGRELLALDLALSFDGTDPTEPSAPYEIHGPVAFAVVGGLDLDQDGSVGPGEWEVDPYISFQAIGGGASVIVPLVPVE